MCSLHPLVPRIRIISQRPYDDWSEIVLCAVSLFCRNRINNTILCDEYNTGHSKSTLFNCVYRHYLHIGTQVRLEECSECCIILPLTRAYADCNTCIRIREGFLEYLRETGDKPYNNPEPIVVAITQIITSRTE